MAEQKKQSYLGGAALLAAAVAIVKVIGFFYKIPLYNLLGDEGTTHFQVTYAIYSLLLTVSTAGIPVAMSRLISSARALGRKSQVDRLFSMGMRTFIPVGLIGMGAMLIFARQFANFMGDPEVTDGIRVLAPAVLFVCIVSVYRGYAQGHSYMTPTAVSQVVEVIFKLIFGLAIAWVLVRRGKDTAAVSAGAIVGVTLGLAAVIPIMAYYKRRLDKSTEYPEIRYEMPEGKRSTVLTILKISIPITLSTSIMSIITLIDTKLVLQRLQSGAGLSYETAKILNGAYSKGLTLFNLPSAFITPLTVAVVPTIAAAVARRESKEARRVMESAVKVENLLAMPAGIGLFVLSVPIYNVLFPNSNANGPQLLANLGIASYFVCTYLVTNAILQANGYEKLSLITLPLGGLVKIVMNWILVGNPDINIKGAPIGTISCYVFITVLNLIFIRVKVADRPRLFRAFAMPAICTAVLGAAAWAVYGLSEKVVGKFLAAGRIREAVCMVAAIGVAVIVYAVMIVFTGTVTTNDLELVPKGKKIGRLLRVKYGGKH